jgi:hypothetical protein
MKKKTRTGDQDELRPEYDLNVLLKGAVRGKYVRQYRSGTNLVLLEPDIAQAFTSDQAVNAALRLVLQLNKIPNRTAPKANKLANKTSQPPSRARR